MEYYNFGAGPAMLPKEVVNKIREDLPHWRPGLSAMEVSHRSSLFLDIVEESEQNLRELLSIPNNYKVLFPTGGARAQFAMVPLNLLGNKHIGDYVITGLWSKLAWEDASQFCTANIAASSELNSFVSIPSEKTWSLSENAGFVHYTDNETVHGIEFTKPPKTGKVPLVADMTSNILSKSIDVSDYGVIYASAQKNLGIAGITVAIVDENVIKAVPERTPHLYNYSILAKKNSILNTPPVFPWYVLNLVLRWAKDKGGIKSLEQQAKIKSDKLYKFLDESNFYYNSISATYRSRINVPFKLIDKKLDDEFIAFAKERGIVQIKGHKTVGGMRASIYNAMPESGVDALISVMKEFEQKRA